MLDTGAWIAWFADEPLADAVAPHLARMEDVIVPAVVEFEVYRWALRHTDEDRAAAYAARFTGGRFATRTRTEPPPTPHFSVGAFAFPPTDLSRWRRPCLRCGTGSRLATH